MFPKKIRVRTAWGKWGGKKRAGEGKGEFRRAMRWGLTMLLKIKG